MSDEQRAFKGYDDEMTGWLQKKIGEGASPEEVHHLAELLVRSHAALAVRALAVLNPALLAQRATSASAAHTRRRRRSSHGRCLDD